MRLRESVRSRLLDSLLAGRCSEYADLVDKINRVYRDVVELFHVPAVFVEEIYLDKYSHDVFPVIMRNVSRCMDRAELVIDFTVPVGINMFEAEAEFLYDEIDYAMKNYGSECLEDIAIKYWTRDAEEFLRVLDMLKHATKIYWIPSYDKILDTGEMMRILKGDRISARGYTVVLDGRITNGYLNVFFKGETRRNNAVVSATAKLYGNRVHIDTAKEKIQEINNTYPSTTKDYTLTITPDTW